MLTIARTGAAILLGSLTVAGCGSGPLERRSALPPRKAAPDLIRLVPPRPAPESAVPRPGLGQGVAWLLVDAQAQPHRPDLDLVPGVEAGRRLDA
jgi:hypothetical protein